LLREATMRARPPKIRRSSSTHAVVEFAEDARGAIFVEYVVVVGVGLLVATALSAVGATEVSTYSNGRAMLSTENP
jgi:Flp pilus assembly pilin Flp